MREKARPIPDRGPCSSLDSNHIHLYKTGLNTPFHSESRMLHQHQTPSLLILVSPDTLEGARRSIYGCEVCSNNAVVPFAQVLDRLTGHFVRSVNTSLMKTWSAPHAV